MDSYVLFPCSLRAFLFLSPQSTSRFLLEDHFANSHSPTAYYIPSTIFFQPKLIHVHRCLGLLWESKGQCNPSLSYVYIYIRSRPRHGAPRRPGDYRQNAHRRYTYTAPWILKATPKLKRLSASLAKSHHQLARLPSSIVPNARQTAIAGGSARKRTGNPTRRFAAVVTTMQGPPTRVWTGSLSRTRIQQPLNPGDHVQKLLPGHIDDRYR